MDFVKLLALVCIRKVAKKSITLWQPKVCNM